MNAPSIKNEKINVFNMYRGPSYSDMFSIIFYIFIFLFIAVDKYQTRISTDGGDAWLFFFLFYFVLTSSFLILSLIFLSFIVMNALLS